LGAQPYIYIHMYIITNHNPNIPEPQVVIPPTYGAYHPQVGIIILNTVWLNMNSLVENHQPNMYIGCVYLYSIYKYTIYIYIYILIYSIHIYIYICIMYLYYIHIDITYYTTNISLRRFLSPPLKDKTPMPGVRLPHDASAQQSVGSQGPINREMTWQT